VNLEQFKNQVSSQGLARQNRWVCRVYPPSGLTSTGNALSNALSQGGNRINVNLPGLDAIDAGVAALNNLNLDLGPVQVGTNFAIPTLGYALTNMGSKLEALNLFCQSCSIPDRDINNSDFVEYGELRSLGVMHTYSDVALTYYCSEDLRERLFFEQWQDVIWNPRNSQHGYYSSYTSRVEIIKYSADWKRQEAAYRLVEAYPTNVGAIELSHAEGLCELQIQFKFRKWERIS